MTIWKQSIFMISLLSILVLNSHTPVFFSVGKYVSAILLSSKYLFLYSKLPTPADPLVCRFHSSPDASTTCWRYPRPNGSGDKRIGEPTCIYL